MKVIVDTRERKNAHVLKWFTKNNIEYICQKLNVGDYALLDNQSVVVERKQNLGELSHNLMNREDRARFLREVRRAWEQRIKLVVLCEHGGNVKNVADVANWHDKYSGVSGRALMEQIYKLHIAYSVEFLFCSKKQTGRRILEILEGGG